MVLDRTFQPNFVRSTIEQTLIDTVHVLTIDTTTISQTESDLFSFLQYIIIMEFNLCGKTRTHFILAQTSTRSDYSVLFVSQLF